MKKFYIVLSALLMVVALQITSCSKKESTPVDKYIEILDRSIQQAQKINSIEDMTNFQSVISPEEAQEIIKSSYDYELTDSDKEKLKKTTDKLIRVAFDKTLKFSNFNDEAKKNAETQIDIAIQAANTYIDNAKTLGQISGMR